MSYDKLTGRKGFCKNCGHVIVEWANIPETCEAGIAKWWSHTDGCYPDCDCDKAELKENVKP
jgi:hypothetical protein